MMRGTLLPHPLLLALLLAACTVGPDYKGPPEVAPTSQAAGHFQRTAAAPVDAATPPARWWDGMNDAELTRLVDLALATSPTLKVAEARVVEARALVAQQRAALLPQGNATALAAKARIPTGALATADNQINAALAREAITNPELFPGGTPPHVDIPNHVTTELYNVGFDARWELDLFGGTRRQIEAAAAQTDAAAARVEDAQVQLAAEVGQAYVSLRDTQQRLDLTRASSAAEHRMLDLTVQKRRLGTATDADVARMEVQARQTDAQIPPLEGQVEQAMDRLALLTAQEPGALDAELTPIHPPNPPVPLPPAVVAVADPAALLRRRPDIRAAERQLAASNAGIGYAVAQLFPSVSIFGSIGFGSNKVDTLFQSSSLSMIGAPMLSWNVLDWGRVRARIRQASAANQESLAQYQSTVLQALQDAEAALSRYGHQRQATFQLAGVLEVATRSAQLAEQRYRGGTATALEALDAERQRLQAEQGLAQAQAETSTDYIALQKSLGLGWQPVDPAALPDPPDY
ncbi:efflux transporter outer membrane subunit [Azospirillum sp. B4]|uniref:efflux transporter outer membrane subunit n=1 Tax=Azospirillum sp. B4 TaxID=95605 RepID=UPI00034D7F19|nr:efflux transporter outer membrane subunit [Azospirillum sp. B4]